MSTSVQLDAHLSRFRLHIFQKYNAALTSLSPSCEVTPYELQERLQTELGKTRIFSAYIEDRNIEGLRTTIAFTTTPSIFGTPKKLDYERQQFPGLFKLPLELRQQVLGHAFEEAMERDVTFNIERNHGLLNILIDTQYLYWHLAWKVDYYPLAIDHLPIIDAQIMPLLKGYNKHQQRPLPPHMDNLARTLAESSSQFREEMEVIVRQVKNLFIWRMEEVLPEGEGRSVWQRHVSRFMALRVHLVILKSFVETVEQVRGREEADTRIAVLQTLQ